jgi:hypothetical protein
MKNIPNLLNQAFPGSKLKVLIATIFLTCSTGLLAQQTTPEQVADTVRLPEEITVTGPVSLHKLKNEINIAKEAFFTVFNDLNDEPRFDIHCSMVQKPGTRMKFHQCHPNYYLTAMEEEAELIWDGVGFLNIGAAIPATTFIATDNDKLEERIKEAFSNSPEFVEAINNFEYLSQLYEEKRREIFSISEDS